MFTYQDLLEKQTDDERLEFVRAVIEKWKGTGLYKLAATAEQYYKGQNATIMQYQKFVTKVTGERIPDIWSANFKISSNFFYRFTTQKINFLLGNGISFTSENTAEKLGTKEKPIDTMVKKASEKACVGGVSFNFFNLDHVETFGVTEFAPLYDEEDGALKAGVRFWQIDEKKPLRATLYEIDGITEYRWKDGKGEVTQEKRPYKQKIRYSEVSGAEIYDGENYAGFPIVPLWGNSKRQSDIVGIREQIDCFDLIKSGFANTIDEASFVYWTLQNAGGMDDIDLAEFLKRVRELHAVVTDDDVTATPSSLQPPFEARETLLKRLEKDLYRDAMALDVETISSGAATATEIKAAYEPLNIKCDDYEYCVLEFIQGIFAVAGIDDEPTFTRSMVINVSEDIQTVLQAAAFLDTDYVTEKILKILGDGDKAAEMLKKMNADSLERLATGYKSKSIPDDESELLQSTENKGKVEKK